MKRLGLLSLLLFSSLLSAAERVALVIGNNDYAELSESRQLTSAVNDAKDVAAALKALGYTVISGDAIANADRNTIITATETFASKSKNADAAVFYFSGHGIQVGEDNFLMPSDTPRLTGYSVLKNRSIHLREVVMVALEEAQVKTKVIILDCCRENPFTAQLDQALGQIGKSLRTKGGLGEISGYGPGFFLAFATSPGTIADDGNGKRNSPFTDALLTHLKTSAGDDITPLFRRVKATVRDHSGADQVPWTNDSLLESFAFGKQQTPAEGAPPTPPTPPPAPATAAASAPKTAGDLQGWEMLHHEDRDYVAATSISKFYRFTSLEFSKSRIKFTSPVLVMNGTPGSRDFFINNMKMVLNYPVLQLNQSIYISRLDLCKIIDPVLRPSYIGQHTGFDTVILDPAILESKPGTTAPQRPEADYPLKLARAMRTDLEKRGLKVVLTREDNTPLSVEARSLQANSTPRSIYLHLQFKNGTKGVRGIESIALAPQGAPGPNFPDQPEELGAFPGNKRDSENIALATALQASAVHNLRLTDGGVHQARLEELRALEQPGVSFVAGYLTHPSDVALLKTDKFHKDMAQALGRAIENFRRAVGKKQEP